MNKIEIIFKVENFKLQIKYTFQLNENGKNFET